MEHIKSIYGEKGMLSNPIIPDYNTEKNILKSIYLTPEAICEYTTKMFGVSCNSSTHKLIPLTYDLTEIIFNYIENNDQIIVKKIFGNYYNTYSSKWEKTKNIDLEMLLLHKNKKECEKKINKDNESLFCFKFNNKKNEFYIIRIYSDLTVSNSDKERFSTYILSINNNFNDCKEFLYNAITNNFENNILDETLEPINDKLDDFDVDKYIITEDLKSLFSDIEMFTNNKKFYNDNRLPYKRGTLLIGSPGCGKTMSLKYIVNKYKIPMIVVSQFDIYSVLESLEDAFESVRILNIALKKPVILFIEEINVVLEQPGGRELFLTYLDGVKNCGEYYFIGTTNKPETIDDAILRRPSRIDNIIKFQNPSEEDRHKYIENYFSWNEKEIKNVVALTEGFSFAFLKNFYIEYVLGNKSNKYNEKFVKKIVSQQKKHIKSDMKEMQKAVNMDEEKIIGF
jgi:SpoVK/Ycf46/Vps4 family AAA+-type ATPase